MEETPGLTHVDDHGNVQMVDVSAKSPSARTAVAEGRVLVGEETYELVARNDVHKGDVLPTAQLAGVMGAKHTSHLIPLCHQVSLTGIDVELTLNEQHKAIDIRAYTKSTGPTGVEMEALTAVSIAALTVYDMCKSVSKKIEITGIRLLAKTGGASGDFRRGRKG